MRRLVIVASVILAVGACPAAGAVARTSAALVPSPGLLRSDFNNDGFVDQAIGVPGEDVGAVGDAGAVAVFYGGGAFPGEGSQLFTQNGAGSDAEPGDLFGDAVAVGDFNNDGFADLAAGAPGDDVGTAVGPAANAGAVNVLYGSAAGLTGTGAQELTQNSPGVPSSPERNDRFGTALGSADFDNDGFSDLAVGVPFESGQIRVGGAVVILHGSAAGLTGAGSQLINQDSPGVGGSSENGDAFGDAVVADDFDDDGFGDLAVGVPTEDVVSAVDAGAVTVLYGSASGLTGTGSQLFTQDTAGVGGSSESGDEFGFALAAGGGVGPFDPEPGPAELAIGVPGEDVFAVVDAGAVTVLFGSTSGLTTADSRVFTQNNIGPGSSAEAGDAFGFAVAVADGNGNGSDEEPGGGGMDVLIGVPGEDVFGKVDAGVVNVAYESSIPPGPLRETLFVQPGPGAGPETGDLFGFSLAGSGILTRVVIGAPGEDVNSAGHTVRDAGVVSFLSSVRDVTDHGNGGFRSVTGLLYQNSPGVPNQAEPGDFFGDAVARLGSAAG